jgi:hypothetical protein
MHVVAFLLAFSLQHLSSFVKTDSSIVRQKNLQACSKKPSEVVAFLCDVFGATEVKTS